MVGGDALSFAHIRKALPYLPEGLLNGYGPTENTTFSCVHHIRSLDEEQTTVPIGRPIAYSQAYVLDDQAAASSARCHWRDLCWRNRARTRLSWR
ncbi:AMP-binding protein [Bacillus sp. SL00103]